MRKNLFIWGSSLDENGSGYDLRKNCLEFASTSWGRINRAKPCLNLEKNRLGTSVCKHRALFRFLSFYTRTFSPSRVSEGLISRKLRLRKMENGGQEIPENANEHCPGPQSESAGKSDACDGCPNQEACATAPKGPDPDLVAIVERMAKVKHKMLVLSGKGGVGKSTFSAQLSFALAAMNFQVGLLDIDICGPSIPKMLGLEGQEIHQSNFGWSPVYVESNLGVMSIGFMLPNPDDAVIWRGPRKNGIIKQFLKDVDWGELDFLVVDAPPGTSDEHISIVQFLQATGIDGAIIVTTPQQVSLIDVRKEVSFCKKVGLPVLGVVENMSGLCQPLSEFKFLSVAETGEQKDMTEWVIAQMREKAPDLLQIFAFSEVFDSSAGGGAKMCLEMGVPFLGKVPLDPQLCKAAEEGRSCFEDVKKCPVSAPAIKTIVKKLLSQVEV
ncbi:unnamed protein product [Fraxinus pennsylvanica]|uniref:Cytosolic Fe-S cluster assembly factor NBP35 n=1 Tax=Fraxinus pennsylvanica TaxID=56036 RepID=A0AAD1ZC49_9LAMI|nr:unnamed protein product [Fraxinus pennsylvanica]